MDRKRILIIDDERGFTAMLSLNLESLGHYEVRVENDAVCALKTAQDFKPDLILLDVIMPQAEGPQIASAIKQHPELQHVPIIYLTATTQSLDKDAPSPAEGFPCVAKPSNLTTLLAMIEKHLA